jgi:hypothetical protein
MRVKAQPYWLLSPICHLSSVISHFLFPDMRPVIFDTDIGTDVDDILALVLLGKAPELQLIGVTTVYGDTLLRASAVSLILI